MVTVKQFNDEERAYAKHLYRNTPVYKVEDIPRGMSAHVGDGWWVTKCRECDEVAHHLGSRPRYWTIDEHKVAVHHIAVAGLNQPLL